MTDNYHMRVPDYMGIDWIRAIVGGTTNVAQITAQQNIHFTDLH